jgi:acyl-CoA dehydrogenase
MMLSGISLGLADGPTEVHKDTVAKKLLKGYRPAPGMFPTAHLPARIDAAREKYADYLADI